MKYLTSLNSLHTDPRKGIENALVEEKSGCPTVENRQREAQNETIVKRVMDPRLDGWSHGSTQANCWSEPLSEGTHIGSEEGVNGVKDAVLRAEPPVRYAHQRLTRPECVHHVRTGTRHVWGGKVFSESWELEGKLYLVLSYLNAVLGEVN